MSKKREKPQGGASMEAWRTKMEVFEERLKMMERLASFHADLIRGHITPATHIYKTATLPLRFTKMPL